MQALTDKLYISAQINQADLAQAAAVGIRTLICNRPDGEDPEQPDWATIQAWAHAVGIEQVHYLPVTMPNISLVEAKHFANIINTASPTLAYCRTGTRSCLLWALDAVTHGSHVDTAIQQAARIGIDLSTQQARLQAAAQQAHPHNHNPPHDS